MSSHCNDIITIQYNDQTVQLNPDRPLNMKWMSHRENGIKSMGIERIKPKQFTDLLIPKTKFKNISHELAEEKGFKMPIHYIQYTGREEESGRDQVEYDLDREDLEWLQLINTKRVRENNMLVEESLEKAVDFLEKESYFQYTEINRHRDHLLLPMIDNDAPCCICNDSEDSNANQIIFCDMCNIAVHQECYGVPYIPEGQWLCRRCQLSPSASVHCALCPFTTGAFKQTADGRWVHVICTIWLNEVHFANTVFLEPVEGVDFSLKRRHKLTCIICRNKVGACLQCSHRTCSRAFHVTCAYYAGMKMEVKENRTKKNPEAIIINRFVYCHQHSKNGPKNDESQAAWKREIQAKFREARKRLLADVKGTKTSVPVPVIPQEKINEIAQSLQIPSFSDIVSYWSMKRQSRWGVPLIRRLQVYVGQQKPFMGRHSLDGRISSLDQQPTTSRIVSDQQSILHQQEPRMRMANMRQSFERIRLLCELVKKREKLKLESVCSTEKMLTKMKPLATIMRQTLDKLVEKDHQNIFTQPVNEEEVPGYRDIICNPMDLQEMRRRLENGQYARVADIKKDFQLMMQNCDTFNRDNQYFFNYGHRIKRIGLTVIKNAEAEEANIGQVLKLMGPQLDLMDSNSLKRLKMETKYYEKHRGFDQQSNSLIESDDINLNEKRQIKQSKDQVIFKERLPANEVIVPTSSTLKSRKRKASDKLDDKNQSHKRKCSTSSTANTTQLQLNASREQMKTPPRNSDNLSATTQISPPRRLSTSNKRRKSMSNRIIPHQSEDVSEQKNNLEESEKTTRKKGNKVNQNNASNKMTSVNEVSSAAIQVTFNTPMRPKQITNRSTTITDRTSQTKMNHSKIKSEIPLRRGVEKQTYMNAYLTEASSAADDSDSAIGIAMSPSIDEDELPSIGGSEPKNDKQKRRVYRQIEKFQHNDIVWVPLENGVARLPARVIDLCMRFDVEHGLGEEFIKHALETMPKKNTENEYTLVLLFDKQNTWMWMPNERLELCQLTDFDTNQKSLYRNPVVSEALDKARIFRQNVLMHI